MVGAAVCAAENPDPKATFVSIASIASIASIVSIASIASIASIVSIVGIVSIVSIVMVDTRIMAAKPCAEVVLPKDAVGAISHVSTLPDAICDPATAEREHMLFCIHSSLASLPL
ncbi:hypothetical protein E4U53_004121 [Claviceps sorghi]|nr:hypothetical protein E4U53_004121 [Claviceps sorghi]